MADDRIFLVCTGCGKRITLYKFYANSCGRYPGALVGYSAERADLDQFIEQHLYTCRPELGGRRGFVTLMGDPGFVLVTETRANPEDNPPMRKAIRTLGDHIVGAVDEAKGE